MLQHVGEHVESVPSKPPETDSAVSPLGSFQLSRVTQTSDIPGFANQGWELCTGTALCAH